MAWNEGGAAFPQPSNTGTDGGLTKHDYFTSEMSAAIVQGMIASGEVSADQLHRWIPDQMKEIVQTARRFADHQLTYVTERGA